MSGRSIGTGDVRRLAGVVALAIGLLLCFRAVPASAGSVGTAGLPVHYGFVWKVGNYGTGPGLFDNPAGVAVSPSSGDVYVTDASNNRVQRFDAGGNFLGEFGETGSGRLNGPAGISVDPATGNVYVFDYGDARVVEFDAAGTYLGQFGGPGDGPGEFGSPQHVADGGLAIDPATGTVYVVDSSHNRVERFTLAGRFLGEFGDAGAGAGALSCPSAVAVGGRNDDVYVVDGPCGDIGVKRFTSDGSFLGNFDVDAPVALPDALAIDPVTGDVFVGDYYGERVYVVDAHGGLLGDFGHDDVDGGSIGGPLGLALDPTTEDVYIAVDSQYVVKFGPTPLRATSTVVTCPRMDIALGEAITCLATVADTDSGSPVTPTGTVDVSSGGAGSVSGAPCTLAGTGAGTSCAFSFVPTALGNIQLVATYSGDPAHSMSANGSFNPTVLYVAYPTQTRISCDPSVVLSGMTTTCTARVVANSGGAPSGQVTLTGEDGPRLKDSSCTLTVVSDRAAECQIPYRSTAIGVRQLIATYGGSATDDPTKGHTVVRVKPRSTGIAAGPPRS